MMCRLLFLMYFYLILFRERKWIADCIFGDYRVAAFDDLIWIK